ncbi:MAG: hypothetical protein VX815_16905 [Gemmatimonadota bacterium]|jgi:hypothetical protein|nr:hypothetical protein [Gemmatimonadota bacterium]
MSLIRVRRRRKKNWIAATKGMSSRRLMTLLALTIGFIWFIGWRY